jgi:hypothetical protein
MPYSKEEREMWLSDRQESGKSAYCCARTNGLNPQTFKNWKFLECTAYVELAIFPASL